MENLTPRQRARLERLAKSLKDRDVAAVEHLSDIEEKVDEVAARHNELSATVSKVAETLEKGFLELSECVYEIDPEAIRGEPGEPGADADEEEIIERIIPAVLSQIPPMPTPQEVAAFVPNLKGDAGEPGLPGKDGEPGKPGQDGSPDTPLEIAYKLNTTRETVEPHVIKGLDEIGRLARIGAQNVAAPSASHTALQRLSERVDAAVAAIPAAYTDEQAQDAVGGILDATLRYVDATPLIGIDLAHPNTWTGQQTFDDAATVHEIGVVAPKLYPAADSTTAVGVYKADGSTALMTFDTTNSRVAFNVTGAPAAGTFQIGDASYANGFNSMLYVQAEGGGSVEALTVVQNAGFTAADIMSIRDSTGFVKWRVDGSGGTMSGAWTIAGGGTFGVSSGGDPAYISYTHVGGGKAYRTRSSADGSFDIYDATASAIRLAVDTNGNVGAGVATASIAARAHFVSTAEQLRLGYDASNYLSATVDSSGNLALNLTGTSPEFTFADPVNVPDEAYGAGWNGSTEVPTKNAVYDKIETLATTASLANAKLESPGFTVDGGGAAIATGKVKGFFTCPYAGTITGWSIVADTGTVTVKVWKIATGTAKPTSANSINTSGVSLSSGTAIRSSTLTDFTTTAIAAGDILAYNIEAVSGATEMTFNLEVTKS